MKEVLSLLFSIAHVYDWNNSGRCWVELGQLLRDLQTKQKVTPPFIGNITGSISLLLHNNIYHDQFVMSSSVAFGISFWSSSFVDGWNILTLSPCKKFFLKNTKDFNHFDDGTQVEDSSDSSSATYPVISVESILTIPDPSNCPFCPMQPVEMFSQVVVVLGRRINDAPIYSSRVRTFWQPSLYSGRNQDASTMQIGPITVLGAG